jgi:uncharacterized membrane protein YuzA (DUF378 family)
MARDIAHPGHGTLAFLKVMTTIALIGALNWGLIGIFNWNLVDALFGGGAVEETSTASRVVYALVGLCGLVSFFLLPAARSEDSSRPIAPTPRPF